MFRNILWALCIQLPSILASCITTLNFKTRKLTLIQSIEFIQISPVLHAHVCVHTCVFSCSTIKCVVSRDDHHSQDTEQVPRHKAHMQLLYNSTHTPIPSSLSNNHFSISVIFLFLECSINGVMQHLNFYVLTQPNSLLSQPGCSLDQ